MSREILFRAKLKDWKTNPNHNRWVEGFYLKRKETTYCIEEDYERNPVKTVHYIAKERMTDWGLPNEFTLYEIDPDTLCQSIGYKDNDNISIFENDVVELKNYSMVSHKYLIWYCKEMSVTTAIPLKGIEFNGYDYWNSINPYFDFSNFCLMLQDPYGDFSGIKIIGNIIDDPELIEYK